MQKKLCTIFIVCIFSSIQQITATTPGTLDTIFNTGGAQPGTISTNINNFTNRNRGQAVALQTDGKIVVAGFTQIAPGGADEFAVARFNTDGTLDTTFNSGGAEPGTAITAVDNSTDAFGQGVAIQSDGKIVVAGRVTVSGVGKFGVARFNTDGTLDTTFNALGAQPGTVSTLVDGGISASGFAVALQSDGKIVVAGVAGVGGQTRFGVARFSTNGTLDTTFNALGAQPGTLSTLIDGGVAAAGHGVAIQADGKIVAVGFENAGGVFKFAVARFNTNGTLDTAGFNAGGAQPGTAATLVDGSISDRGEAVAIQTDGKIVVAGFTDVENFGVARFNADGTLDTTGFNAGGVQPGTASTTVDNGTTQECYGVAIQTNGKIVVAGSVFDFVSFGVARFNADGTLDTTFNPSGVQPGTVSTTIDAMANDNEGFATVIQTDGKIVVAGYMNDGNNDKFAVARFNADPPTSYGGLIINQPGTYMMPNDLVYSPTIAGDAIVFINANNVKIDFQNHFITQQPGNLQPGLDGIIIGRGLGNISIRNVKIENISGVGIHVSDGCTNIGVWDSNIQGCNAAGIVLDGFVNGAGITGVEINNCHVTSCTGASGNPAYGIHGSNGLLCKISNAYMAFNDAGITTSAYGVRFDNWCGFQLLNSTITYGGGIGTVAGLASSLSYTGLLENNIFYKNTNRDLTATGTVCGVLLDQSSNVVTINCKSTSNINKQMAAMGFLAQNGSQNLFNNCIADLSVGGKYAAGFKFYGEQKSTILDCLIQNQRTLTSGTAYGIVFSNNCDKCQIINTKMYNNSGASSSFGIVDERTASTSAIIKNYAFNNGTNYSVTYPAGVTLPVLSASLSSASPGIPSNTGGILDNIDVSP